VLLLLFESKVLPDEYWDDLPIEVTGCGEKVFDSGQCEEGENGLKR
jgi:hypothetical protein